MSSLNLLSGISTSLASPPSRHDPSQPLSPHDADPSSTLLTPDPGDMEKLDAHPGSLANGRHDDDPAVADEKTALLAQPGMDDPRPVTGYTTWMLTRHIPGAIAGAVRMVLAATLAPGRYLVACFYDDEGCFSPLLPIYRVARAFARPRRRAQMHPSDAAPADAAPAAGLRQRASSSAKGRGKKAGRRSPSVASSAASTSALTSDSEFDSERPSTRDGDLDGPSRHTRSRSSLTAGDEIAPAKRSIRIKLHTDDMMQERKRRAKKSSSAASTPDSAISPEEAAAVLKSPTSPASSKLTKFPRAPMPPRPLVPRRQPSYTTAGPSLGPHPKTLVLDLDETLIHSQVKGGRFTTGHMVEVKLQQPIGVGGVTLGPTVPILYYVNKRPHCDEFLRKISKWYNLVIFTASMQEYADPVIDWLEAEYKYFAARYYRQHCTARGASYIKDLSQVEPDLSKVMILDNSPICYAFHPDNAIPIDGWTSDPTDNDLMYLIPLLEGLQYVTDVRALLGLRLGQPQAM